MLVRRRIKIRNPQGLHARPASIFVKIANKYECSVIAKKGKTKVNGKSIMGLMMLAANEGAVITIEAQGTDADKAVHELERFLTKTDEADEGLSL